MAIIKIAPNSEKRVPTSSKYLNIVKSSGALYVFNEDAGVKEFQAKQNNTIEMDGVNFLYFVNKSNVELVVEYQTNSLFVHAGDSGTVEITGSVVVDSITQGISVNASVGSVEILPANTFTESEDISLSTTANTLVLGADITRKEAELFLHGEDFSMIRIGSNAISATKGRILTGGGGVIGSITISGTDAIYVKKISGTNPKIAVGVEKRV